MSASTFLKFSSYVLYENYCVAYLSSAMILFSNLSSSLCSILFIFFGVACSKATRLAESDSINWMCSFWVAFNFSKWPLVYYSCFSVRSSSSSISFILSSNFFSCPTIFVLICSSTPCMLPSSNLAYWSFEFASSAWICWLTYAVKEENSNEWFFKYSSRSFRRFLCYLSYLYSTKSMISRFSPLISFFIFPRPS